MAIQPEMLNKTSNDVIDKLYRSATERPKSIAGQARKSIFEFPAFISSSVDYKYAEATCNLLELTYASYLQMAISRAPQIDVADYSDPFAQWKTDTNNYLECSNLTDTFDACHNVITEDGVTYEFSLTSIPDRTAQMINEAVEYEPLSEFDHYFQEADKPDRPNYTDNDMASAHTTSRDYLRNSNGEYEYNSKGDQVVSSETETTTPGSYGVDKNNEELYGTRLKNTETAMKIDAMEKQEQRLQAEDERLKAAEQRAQERHAADMASLDNDPEYKQIKKEREAYENAKAAYEASKRATLAAMGVNDPDISLAQLKQLELQDYDEDRRMKLSKHRFETKLKTPELMDESKVQKLNSLKPLTMTVEMRVTDKDGSSGVLPMIAGVKVYSRVIDAETLPEVAEFPLKEMNNLTRNIRWKAGELKFLTDIVFRIKEKKQTAIDSHDPKRKWYRRLYELAHTVNDSASVNTLTKGKTGLKSRIVSGVISKLNGGSLNADVHSPNRGFLPDASIIISKDDVNNVLAETGIDLLNNGKATAFCRELFLMNFVVIDMDAQTIKVLTPDLHKDFEIHTLASVEKQLSMIDTASATSR